MESSVTDTRDAGRFLAAARAALEEYYGFPDFRPGQLAAIEAVGEGRDALLIMPTGSGKSVAYQVPALILPGITLVVSPLIALMKDQVDGLQVRGIPATVINSSLSADEQWERLAGVRDGRYRMVYVAPERFRNRGFRETLRGIDVALLAVDEAHCISQWGHDFRPDYRRLAEIRERLEPRSTIALTATATPEVRDDIVRQLGMGRARVHRDGLRPSESRPRGHAVPGPPRKDGHPRWDRRSNPEGQRRGDTRRHRLRRNSPPRGHGRGAPRIPLRRAGPNSVLPRVPRGSRRRPSPRGPGGLHGGSTSLRRGDERLRHGRRQVRHPLRRPLRSPGKHRGLLPGDRSSWARRSSGAVQSDLRRTDRLLQEFFIAGANPSRREIESVHEFLWKLDDNPIFRSLSDLWFQMSSAELDGTPKNDMGFRSAIAVLDHAGAIERLDHYTRLAEVAPRPERSWSENPYAAKANVRRSVWEALRRTFERSDQDAASVDLGQWARDLDLGEDGLRRAFQHLVEDGWIRYTPPFRGRALRLPELRGALRVDFEALRRKRQREDDRLGRMLRFARARECRRHAVLRYFGGEPSSDTCESCDVCQSSVEEQRRPLSDDELKVVRMALSGVARAKGRCGRQRIVQMLRGSRARTVSDLGLDQLSTFGLLRRVPKSSLVELFERLEEHECVRDYGDARYPVLWITPRGLKVMKGEESVDFAFPARLGRALVPTRGGDEDEDLEGDDERLFQELRHLRRRLAEDLGIPAYRVFAGSYASPYGPLEAQQRRRADRRPRGRNADPRVLRRSFSRGDSRVRTLGTRERGVGIVSADWVAIVPYEEIPEGEARAFEVAEEWLVVCKVGGRIFAVEDTCPHDTGPLGDSRLEGHEVVCPRHGARFDVRSGEVLCLPALIGIRTFASRVSEDGQIEVHLPRPATR